MLSATTRYALRALVNLAGMPEGKSLLGRDLSKIAGIPPNYLSKILWTLGSAGFIAATRGTHGGYRLQRRPEEVRLIDIVETGWPQDRDSRIVQEEYFGTITARLWRSLREESMKAIGKTGAGTGA